MDLSSILTPDAIRVSMNTSSKKRLLQDMADIAEQVHGLPAQAVYEAMQERESLGPTGMGGGVAIPHARLPQLDRVVGLFASLARPVDFEAVDRRPVDLVFVLLAPAEAGAEHLRALARVSRTLRDASICEKLRSATDAAALYALMTDESASQAA
ncbi:MAG: PTS IIA-like nitrogen regulatory protein PtsN [Pseudomonadota bacterium]